MFSKDRNKSRGLSDAAKKYAPQSQNSQQKNQGESEKQGSGSAGGMQPMGKIDPKKITPQQAALMQQKQQGGQSQKPHKGTDGNDFQKMQASWAKERVGIAQANLLAIFETDDELPLSKHLLLIAIFAFFLMFFIWANIAKLDELARGQGKVIPSSDVQVVSSLDAGTVEEFMVKEGDTVEKGQVLIRLSDIEASSNLGANNARYMGLLAAITRLQAEAEGKSSVEFPEQVMKAVPQSVTEELNTFRANQQQVIGQTSVLQQQLSQRQQEVRGLQTRLSDIQSVINLQMEEKNMVAPLVEAGSAPRMELLQLDRTIKEKQGELNSAQSSLRQAQGAVNEVNARIREIKTSAQAQAQSELSVKLIEINELKERQSALTDRKDRTELTSPVNGIIQEITVKSVGGVVKPGDDVIKIIPQDDQLIVEARIKPSDRALIYAGQDATVKITSYDFSIYGGLKAKVLDISADTVEDEKGNSFYRVRLRTDKDYLLYQGEKKEIIPGMIASVDIMTGRKTIMQYLMKPLIKTLDVAFSER